jgi:acyl dehydratase
MNFDVIGLDNGYGEATWTRKDAILYALGVGAGQVDPLKELHLTTENSTGVAQQALPTFGCVIAQVNAKRPDLGDFDRSKVLHGEQAFTVHEPLPAEGTARMAMTVEGIYDKGSGALVRTETTVRDADTGNLFLTSRGSLFVRGEGGFGGTQAPASEWALPERAADLECTATVRPDQALLYRLSGDRNPLHSDPAFAAKGGFDRPILHGMCTYGITGRLLLNTLCDGDAARVRGMDGRFSKPVLPGGTLTVRIWADNDTARFQTIDADGDVVLDRGTFNFKAGA